MKKFLLLVLFIFIIFPNNYALAENSKNYTVSVSSLEKSTIPQFYDKSLNIEDYIFDIDVFVYKFNDDCEIVRVDNYFENGWNMNGYMLDMKITEKSTGQSLDLKDLNISCNNEKIKDGFNSFTLKAQVTWFTVYVNIEFNSTPKKVYEPVVQEFVAPDIVIDNVDNDVDEETCLSVSELYLDNGTVYDINVENKVPESTYLWTSTDTSVATVNKNNGIVSAIGSGVSDIICTITTEDSVIDYTCKVTVIGNVSNSKLLTKTIATTTKNSTNVSNNINDDVVSLTETDLELEVGDFFDINVENKIKGSTYRWKSSNKSVLKVNSKNGKINTLSNGNAIVTCIITTPDGVIYVRKCTVSVVSYE